MASCHSEDKMEDFDPPLISIDSQERGIDPLPSFQDPSPLQAHSTGAIPKRRRPTSNTIEKPAPSFPRVRQYPEGPKNRWVVYFRPKNKPLRVTQISKDLNRYSSVLEIMKVGRDKLRVILADRKQANLVVIDTRFTIEYRVYIPSDTVEIDEVVTEENITSTELMGGTGMRRWTPNHQVVLKSKNSKTTKSE